MNTSPITKNFNKAKHVHNNQQIRAITLFELRTLRSDTMLNSDKLSPTLET